MKSFYVWIVTLMVTASSIELAAANTVDHVYIVGSNASRFDNNLAIAAVVSNFSGAGPTQYSAANIYRTTDGSDVFANY